MTKPDPFVRSCGNAFFFVLIGVALFAALSFAVARSFRSDTTNNLSSRKADLIASDILNYTGRIERAVNGLRRRGVSESDISFENPKVAGYANGNCGADSCKVFHPDGAGIGWMSPPTNANDGSEWIITGSSCVTSLGSGGAGCDSDTLGSTEELMIVLPNVAAAVCAKLATKLDFASVPADAGGGASATKFQGSFADGTEITLAGGPYEAACASFGGNNYFYQILLVR